MEPSGQAKDQQAGKDPKSVGDLYQSGQEKAEDLDESLKRNVEDLNPPLPQEVGGSDPWSEEEFIAFVQGVESRVAS
jgi:hypothetical protein